MQFKSKLNFKFYILTLLMLGAVFIGVYGVYFLNANQIMMDDAPMDRQTKMIYSAVISLVTLSWIFSLITLIRQAFGRCAFIIDEDGIHFGVTALVFLAFVFIVPIKNIPFSAIESISTENGALTLHIDKSRIEMNSILKKLVSKDYIISGFAKEKMDVIKAELEKYL